MPDVTIIHVAEEADGTRVMAEVLDEEEKPVIVYVQKSLATTTVADIVAAYDADTPPTPKATNTPAADLERGDRISVTRTRR